MCALLWSVRAHVCSLRGLTSQSRAWSLVLGQDVSCVVCVHHVSGKTMCEFQELPPANFHPNPRQTASFGLILLARAARFFAGSGAAQPRLPRLHFLTKTVFCYRATPNLMGKKNFYAVKQGNGGPAIYESWPECEAKVKGFQGAVFKGFVTRPEAEAFLGGSAAAAVPGAKKAKSSDGRAAPAAGASSAKPNAFTALMPGAASS